MNFLYQIFYSLLFQPLLNGLLLLYSLVGDLGVAAVLLTLIVKVVLFPLSLKALRSQKQMKEIEPKMKEIKNKYKNDIAEQNKAMMDLYREKNISPASGCLPLLIQLPLIIALYRVFSSGLTSNVLDKFLYSFVPNPGDVPQIVFWFFSAESHAFLLVLALIAAFAQFWQSKMTFQQTKSKTPQKGPMPDFGSLMQKQGMFLFPLITFFVIYKTGIIVGVYWFFSVLFSIAEQLIVKANFKQTKP